MITFLAHVLGLDNASGPFYLFWSGIGADLTEFTILGIAYKKLNCHEPGCWRIGLHHVEGKGLVVCRKHHPSLGVKQ